MAADILKYWGHPEKPLCYNKDGFMRKKMKSLRRGYAVASRKRIRHLRRIGKKPLFTVPLATFMVLLVAVMVGFLVSSGGHPKLRERDPNVVVVNFDKKERTIPTDARTVGELLDRLDIKLKEGDVVEPSKETEIASDNFRVNVYRAVPVTIVDGDQKTFTYSAAATPRSIVKQTGVTVYPEDRLDLLPTDNFLTESSIGERVVIARATPVSLNLYGTATTVRTHAKTVGDLMKERDVKLAKDDVVQPSLDTKLTSDIQIFLVRNGTQLQSVEEAVPMPTETVDDPKLAYGTVALRQQGAPGKKVVTYQLELQNGKEVGRKLIQEVVVQNPVKQVIARGSIPLTVSLQTWLLKLRMCESGGNYRTNTGNGFYGAYQFLQSTWNNIARKVRPDLVGVVPSNASPADQDFMIITNTNLSKGGLATQNPGCYKSTGISAYPPANH